MDDRIDTTWAVLMKTQTSTRVPSYIAVYSLTADRPPRHDLVNIHLVEKASRKAIPNHQQQKCPTLHVKEPSLRSSPHPPSRPFHADLITPSIAALATLDHTCLKGNHHGLRTSTVEETTSRHAAANTHLFEFIHECPIRSMSTRVLHHVMCSRKVQSKFIHVGVLLKAHGAVWAGCA